MDIYNNLQLSFKSTNFDLNSILNVLLKTEIIFKYIEFFIDNQKIVQTNIKIQFYRNKISNIPFFADNIIDIHCPTLNIRIFPSIIKVKLDLI